MNDYDKAGRYLVKRDPPGFFRWLLKNPRLAFQCWIDARRVALPNQHDLTSDLVAALRSGKVLEGLCLELEAEARADALTRSLEYAVRFWTEPGIARSLPLTCVSAVVLDLTGRSPANELSLRSTIVPRCRLELTILRRHLTDEQAENLVTGVAHGRISPWLLPWVPLMQGGNKEAIIAEWLTEAERHLTDERDRADLATLTRELAALAGCRPAWEHALRGWTMYISPFMEEARVEGARALIVRQGRRKFGKAPTKKEQKALEAITELAKLEALAERLLAVHSWAELLGEA